MKCPNCGGDIPSRSLACPYCGTANQEEIAFQEEIQKRIERNKLLKPFLIKQKTPELVQKMLTRILIILVGVNVLFLAVALGFFLWGERDGAERTPAEGSKAAIYRETFIETDNYYFSSFLREVNELMERAENGEMPEEYDIEYLVRCGYDAIEENRDEEESMQEEIRMTVNAVFMGYLGLSEEDMKVFAPGEDGNYDLFVDEELLEETKAAITEKLQEVVK